MNKVSFTLMTALLLGGGAFLTNCNHDTAADAQDVGEAKLAVTLAGGATLNSVSYTVTGNGVNRTGTIDVSHSSTISAAIPLPAGGPYVISLSGTATDGTTMCSGMGMFSVTAHQTTPVTIGMLCKENTKSGSVLVTGAINLCPVVDGIAASPTEVIVGSSLQLGASAHDSDALPSALTYAWAAPVGVLSSTTSATPTFKCTQPGPVTITLAASDGDTTPGCSDSQTITVNCSPITSSVSSYILPVASGVIAKPILSVGDSPNLKPDGVTPYRMVGIPDGLGAFDNGDGSFTLLANQELGDTAGIARAHGSKGAFVSKWTVRKSDLAVLSGEDLIKQVISWDPATTAYKAPGTRAFARFCSADLPAISALYDSVSGLGFNGRLFFDGEESGNEGPAWAHGLDGKSYELPRLGKMSFENVVANPGTGVTTLVAGTDDTSPLGQVYFYVGTKTNTGTPVEKAGLTNGQLYGLKVTGLPTEDNAVGLPSATAFTLAPLGNVENTTGTALNTASNTAQVTLFQRPEDAAWDPAHPTDFYFVSTASFTGNSRLWRARFADINNPLAGGTIEMLLSGTEGQKMMDNIGIDKKGHIMIVEDVGNNAHIGRVLRYDIATDTLTPVAQHDPARFITGAPGFLTQDEEASGIIDASDILGAGWWLVDVQAHYSPGDAELVEGGQFLALYDPATL